MQTEKVPVSKETRSASVLVRRLAVREMSADTFVENHASGTLRKNKRLGMAWRKQYLEERTCYEFGWKFECIERSRLTFGDAYTESDCHSVTEAGWHIERLITLSVFPEDRYEAKYIHVEYATGEKKEGIGVIVRQTSAQFVPEGHLVFAIVAEFDPEMKEWLHAENPF
ncbi:MAG: hypothetical protein V4674_03870 [Patescibacteria group bacterium]